jgi:N-acetylglucosaminyl-diphospho-decaprenol L-rhamnosyltransferase
MRAPDAAGPAGLREVSREMTPAASRLTIVIVTYNSSREIDVVLGSLTQPAPVTAHDIVVIDNASSDGTPALMRNRWAAIRLIESGANLGFAAANNRAIRTSSSELVLLLNPDTRVPAGAVDRLVAQLDARADVAIVGPRIVDGHGRAELSFGAMISPLAELRQKVLVWGNDRGIAPIVTTVDRTTRRTHEVDWVSGACLLIRRTDLEAVGLLDERFFLYTEDVDLCASVRARGRRVLFAAEIEIEHLRGRSAGAATAVAYRRSQLAFYEKHHPAWVPWLRAYLKIRGELPDNP